MVDIASGPMNIEDVVAGRNMCCPRPTCCPARDRPERALRGRAGGKPPSPHIVLWATTPVLVRLWSTTPRSPPPSSRNLAAAPTRLHSRFQVPCTLHCHCALLHAHDRTKYQLDESASGGFQSRRSTPMIPNRCAFRSERPTERGEANRGERPTVGLFFFPRQRGGFERDLVEWLLAELRIPVTASLFR